MTLDVKLAANLSPFSSLSDRFMTDGYAEGYEFPKQLEMLAAVEGMQAVDLAWPCQFQDAAAVKRGLDATGLGLLLDTDIYTEPRFKKGSLSSRDPNIRRAAIDRIKGASDAALEFGAPEINVWLGHDGFEYFFESHYADAWKWIVEGFQEAAEHNPNVPIGIEPKCKEPRANQYIANVGRALMLVNKINKPHVGITLDFGHSLAALESPAEAAVLALLDKRLVAVHLNDNYRDWDHDLVPGAVNVWDHVEFFYWLRKLGYQGWYNADIFPYREDGTEVLKRTVQVVDKCCRIADRLMERDVEHIIREGKTMEMMKILWDMVG